MSFFQKALENDLNYLKENLTDITITDEKQKSLLHYAVTNSSFETVNYLLDIGIDVNKQDVSGDTALFDCARKGKVTLAKLLISKYSNVNIHNRNQELPIHLACAKGDLEMIKLLIESGSYLNKKTSDDKLPVHYAILAGHVDIVPYILKMSNQSWFIKDSYKDSLLHYATRTNNLAMVQLFLSHELNPNCLNDQFETPIFNAIRHGSIETVKLLLNHDAYLDIKNRRYETPFDIAIVYNKTDINNYLHEYMSTPAYERLTQKQALSIAVLNRDHVSLRNLLLKATPMKKDRLHKTAIDYAKEYNLTLCIELLRGIDVL